MAKICEYENVSCPFCKSENVEHRDYGELQYLYVPYVKVHICRCKDCLNEFYISCED